ncbi:hypothetical protein DERF_009525 [Dermatophagoides farinae]|uniref:Uncharacterized protein n=1 Tax=Dermatophagoides farinae TaxID=6954 RepID=A0A922HXG7_DERFA|nr:hypothetical protein DERF_009525 [Dermatophagoides farinae]
MFLTCVVSVINPLFTTIGRNSICQYIYKVLKKLDKYVAFLIIKDAKYYYYYDDEESKQILILINTI